MKKIFKNLLLLSTLVLSMQMGVVHAQTDPDEDGFLNDTTIEVLKEFQDESGFSSFSGATDDGVVQQQGLDNITGVLVTIMNIMKYVIGILAVIFLVINIVRLITAGDKSSEQLDAMKKHIIYIMIAFVVVLSIDFFINNVFDITGGDNFLGSQEDAQRFATVGSGEISGIYRFGQAFVGVAAVAALILSGMQMVFNGGNDEAISKAKNHITYAAFALVLIGIAEVLVQGFLFRNGGNTIDIEAGKQLLVTITNFISGFIATISVAAMFYAGYLYVFSGVGPDNNEKVKKIIIGVVIALIVAGGAFAVVNTVVKVDSSRSPDLFETQVDKL